MKIKNYTTMSENHDCGCGHHHADAESKYDFVLSEYNCTVSDQEVAAAVKSIIEEKVEKNNTLEVKKLLFNCIDLNDTLYGSRNLLVAYYPVIL